MLTAVAVVFGIAAVGAAQLTPAGPSYRDGAPPAFSGGFGEETCAACHFDNALNAAPGVLRVSGVPDRYVAGKKYPLAVTLARPEMRLAGFQLTTRQENTGMQAGALEPAEESRVTVVTDRGIDYAFQLHDGSTLVTPDTARWEVIWTAPESDWTVVLNVAANAANGDDSADGDFVYTAEVVIESER